MSSQQIDPHIPQPLDALLGAYAAGTLGAPLHALVGSHLELCDASRRFVEALEGVAGSGLDRAPAEPLASRGRMLSEIMAGANAKAQTLGPDPLLPAPLRHLLGRGSSEIAWRFKLPGIKEYRVSESDGGEAVLYWVKAGRRLPQHTHEGEEVTLLLQGGFTDPLGHYRRGDVAIADAELDHNPVADKDEDCICFAVTDAPLQLTGPVIRLLRKVFRH